MSCIHALPLSSLAMKQNTMCGAAYGVKQCQQGVRRRSIALDRIREPIADIIQAIMEYLPRILQQVERLADLIANYDSRPILLNDVMSWFAFDSMGEFMFNSDFGMMRSSTWHPAIVQQRGALAFLAPLSDMIWLVRLAFAFFPFVGKVRDWNHMVAFCDNAMHKRMQVSNNKCLKPIFIGSNYLCSQVPRRKTLQLGSLKNLRMQRPQKASRTG